MLGRRLHVIPVEPNQQADDRSSCRRGDDGHDNQHPEQRRRQNPGVQPDVEQDQLHRSPGVHEHTEAHRTRSRVAQHAPSQIVTRHNLGQASARHQEGSDPEEVARELHPADPQPGVGEEEGHQEHPHELLHHSLGDITEYVLRNDGSHYEAAEDDVDPSQLCSREAEEQDGAQHGELIAIVQVPLLQKAFENRANH